jgi:hypothetical protein
MVSVYIIRTTLKIKRETLDLSWPVSIQENVRFDPDVRFVLFFTLVLAFSEQLLPLHQHVYVWLDVYLFSFYSGLEIIQYLLDVMTMYCSYDDGSGHIGVWSFSTHLLVKASIKCPSQPLLLFPPKNGLLRSSDKSFKPFWTKTTAEAQKYVKHFCLLQDKTGWHMYCLRVMNHVHSCVVTS